MLKKWRIHEGLSQEDLALMVGVCTSYYNQIEGYKKKPSTKILKRISKETKLDYNKLLKVYYYGMKD